MSISILDFEKPIAEVANKIEALQLAAADSPELLPKIDKLKKENQDLLVFKDSVIAKIRTDLKSVKIG